MEPMIRPEPLRRILSHLVQADAGCSWPVVSPSLGRCFFKRRIAVLAMAMLSIFPVIGLGQESSFPNPAFPFGAVYFRKSNPPPQDWERDHQVAVGLGVNIFRHWFLWA